MPGYRVVRYPFSMTLLFAVDNDEITQEAQIPTGKLLSIVLTVPDLESTDTVTLTLEHPDFSNVKYFTAAGIVESATSLVLAAQADYVPSHLFDVTNPKLSKRGVLIRLLTSGAQTANRAFSGEVHVGVP